MKTQNWLFLRGLARESRHWGELPSLFESLNSEVKVHFLDLPGAGKNNHMSSPLSIDKYTDKLRLEWFKLRAKFGGDWGIMAISMGGMIGMDWCSRFPHDFNSLVLINSSGSNLSPIYHRLSFEALGIIFQLFLKEDLKEREKRILTLTTTLRPISEKLIENYVLISKEISFKRINFLRQIYAAARFKVPNKLEQKILLLAAKKDRLAHYKCTEALAKHLEAPYFIHKSAGHDLPLDDPHWIIEKVESFFS